MKQKAKENFIKQLTKACTDENIRVNLQLLSDKELKDFYLLLQASKCATSPYAISKSENYETIMRSGKLHLVSFKGSYGLRRLTFKEFLLLCEFTNENPHMYQYLDTSNIVRWASLAARIEQI